MNKSTRMTLRRVARAALVVVLLALCLQGCRRRPLEVMLESVINVQLVVDWNVNYAEIYRQKPNGMTVMVWDSKGNLVKMTSVNSDRVSLNLEKGAYRLIVHNETQQEFPYQWFDDYYSYQDIVMRSAHFTTKSWDSGVDYMYYPDPVGVTASDFVITSDMVDGDSITFVYYEDWVENGADYYEQPVKLYTINEVAWPMTVNLYIKAKVKRPQSISTIEGSISGMADGFYLSRVNRTSESGTLRLMNDNSHSWTLEAYGEKQDSTGYIKFAVPSFGLPYGKELLVQRREEDNVLTLNVTLTDGSVIRKTYNVGKQIRYITPEGREAEIRYRQDLHNLSLELDLSEEIVLPPSQSEDPSGFDARVDKWDEEIVDMGGF